MSSKELVGQQLLERQRATGTRAIIEDIDGLRMSFGNDNVKVLTPRVETRLRSGNFAQIPLKLEVVIGEPQYDVTLTFTMDKGYPAIPAVAEVVYPCPGPPGTSPEAEAFAAQSRDQIGHFLSKMSATGSIVRVIDIVQYAKLNILPNRPATLLSCGIGSFSRTNPEIPVEHQDYEIGFDDDDIDNTEISIGMRGLSQVVDPGASVYMTCKLCRERLFEANNLDEHSTTKNILQNLANSKCTSIFLADAPLWLSTQSGEVGGKLNCINAKCNARVGQWSWSGGQCSCGDWISPAFQVNISKVDFKQC